MKITNFTANTLNARRIYHAPNPVYINFKGNESQNFIENLDAGKYDAAIAQAKKANFPINDILPGNAHAPLLAAMEMQAPKKLIEALVAHPGLNPNKLFYEGTTSYLDSAIKSENFDTFKLLLTSPNLNRKYGYQNNINPNIQNKHCETPLQRVMINNLKDFARELLKHPQTKPEIYDGPETVNSLKTYASELYAKRKIDPEMRKIVDDYYKNK